MIPAADDDEEEELDSGSVGVGVGGGGGGGGGSGGGGSGSGSGGGGGGGAEVREYLVYPGKQLDAYVPDIVAVPPRLNSCEQMWAMPPLH